MGSDAEGGQITVSFDDIWVCAMRDEVGSHREVAVLAGNTEGVALDIKARFQIATVLEEEVNYVPTVIFGCLLVGGEIRVLSKMR